MSLVRKVWRRLPVDGAPCLPPASRRTRLFAKTTSRNFWARVGNWYRPAAVLAARIAWALACPLKAWSASRAEYAKNSDFSASVWAGWTRGKNPADTVLHRAFARNDSARLLAGQDIPGDRQSGLLLRALGSAEDTALASDKLLMSKRLAAMGLPVPGLRATIEAGQIPRVDQAPWIESEKLLIKPRFGACARGLFSVQCLGSGRYSVQGGNAIDAMTLTRHLAFAARKDSLLVQRYLHVSDETRALSADAPAVIRAFSMRAAAGERASVITAMLKILPPGMDAPRGIDELLLIPIDVENGGLDEGILLSRPRERFQRNPWNNAAVSGGALRDWPKICEMVELAGAALPATPVIGWDVLLGAEGPVILEANTGISLFRAMLRHFEKGVPSPIPEALEKWCLRKNLR